MFSLPNIKRMNDAAAHVRSRTRRNYEWQALNLRDVHGRRARCEYCSTETLATEGRVWHDIFSDDPKGVVFTCEEHADLIREQYTYCSACGKLIINSYTWESYIASDPDSGEQFCLNCWREQCIERDMQDVGHLLSLDDKALIQALRRAKHLLAVGQECPSNLRFVDNAEFDAYSGKQSGDSIRKILGALKDEGHDKCILILDAAYQFAVSVGVYVPVKEEGT